MAARRTKAELALEYAELRGWPVFPVHFVSSSGRCSCGKEDCGNKGKHPMTAHGFKDASRDPDLIRSWWNHSPGANIGMPTGIVSGVVVLDVDPRHGGDESLSALVWDHEKLPATAEARTGSGGRHYYFDYFPVGNSANKLGPGLDIRGDGGYVLLPGSKTVNEYEWIREP